MRKLPAQILDPQLRMVLHLKRRDTVAEAIKIPVSDAEIDNVVCQTHTIKADRFPVIGDERLIEAVLGVFIADQAVALGIRLHAPSADEHDIIVSLPEIRATVGAGIFDLVANPATGRNAWIIVMHRPSAKQIEEDRGILRRSGRRRQAER